MVQVGQRPYAYPMRIRRRPGQTCLPNLRSDLTRAPIRKFVYRLLGIWIFAAAAATATATAPF